MFVFVLNGKFTIWPESEKLINGKTISGRLKFNKYTFIISTEYTFYYFKQI